MVSVSFFVELPWDEQSSFPRGQLCSWISYLTVQGPERTGVTGDQREEQKESVALWWSQGQLLSPSGNFLVKATSGIRSALSQFSSVQFSHSVESDSLQPHESQHARPPCPSPTPGVHSDSHPSSRWCHPAISSSVIPFSSCPQSLPASKSFLMSQLFAWGGQSTGVSALASFLPKKSQGWSPCSPRDSQESSPTP